MKSKQEPVTIKGRSLGITTLTVAQTLIGIIHVSAGLMLLGSELLMGTQVSIVYDIYTLTFGLLTIVFAVLIWQGKKLGWFGTIAISIFVIIADTLTVLNLPSIPGIPRFAAAGEIPYSLFVVFYLMLPHVRKKFGV
ncbi:MAG: hypothetical protein ACFCUE_01595 [Candidatus Bathyarchaeia archaeon]